MKKDIEIIQDNARLRPKKSEVFRLYCDNSKLVATTGFKPVVDLEMGLKGTIEWFTNARNLDRYKADVYNI